MIAVATRASSFFSLLLAVSAGCKTSPKSGPEPGEINATASAASNHNDPKPRPSTLLEARRGFVTKTHDRSNTGVPAPTPPTALFSLVKYPSAVGPLAAYVSPRPADGRRRPAIVWIVGGFSNSIGSFAWEPAAPDNDQSARAFREAGIALMLPSLRGGNDNPGKRESFYGEVDDVVAAGEYTRGLDYVDPARVYLGGHSTGGTMALLVAESTSRFRTVFAFGPVANVASYGDQLVFDAHDDQEVRLRSPMNFAWAIHSPTWVIEGSAQPSNASALLWLSEGENALLRVLIVPGVTHFGVLAPVSGLLAKKILDDDGPTPSITLGPDELVRVVSPTRRR